MDGRRGGVAMDWCLVSNENYFEGDNTTMQQRYQNWMFEASLVT